MEEFLGNVGLISIVTVLLYTIKKIYDHYDLQRAGCYEDDNIDKAAEEFIQRATSEVVQVTNSDPGPSAKD